MYSQEIESLLKIRQYTLSASEYLNILNTSPQINHIKYNPYDDTDEIDTDDNYHFKFKVKTRN